MKIDGWQYYNHAAIPNCAPHESANLKPIQDHSIWKLSGDSVLLARWVSDYNCGEETDWYYCIKNTPFELNELKSKQRYEINKGKKYFDVSVINPQDYINAIYTIQVEAFKSYPKEYRPKLNYNDVKDEVFNEWDNKIVFAAFDKETNRMASYAIFERKESHIEWSVLKSMPEYEKLKVNAVIIAASLEYFNQDLIQGKYISGGERNISHQTNFQNYLEYLFGFTKVYCKLNIVYRPGIAQIVRIMYPFRKILKEFHFKFFYKMYSVLLMEEIIRKQK